MTDERISQNLGNDTVWYRRYWREIILSVFPILITLVNPNWLYNPTVLNTIDTWAYHGLFRYFPSFANNPQIEAYYSLERLGWILPGFGLYGLFTPEIANIILDFGLFYLAIFSIYATLRRLFNADIGFVIALCLGGYTWFLRAIGHDYLDGGGIVYYLVALWAATEAAYQPTGRYRRYLVGFGACLALTISTQLTWAFFIAIVGCYFLVLNHGVQRHLLILCISSIVLGILGAILPMMAVNWLVTGEPNIFVKSIGAMRVFNAIHDELRTVTISNYAQFPMTWMLLPIVLSAGACLVLTRSRKLGEQRWLFLTIVAVFALSLSIFVFLHLFTPLTYLYIYLYMSMLIPAIFLLFGALLSVRGVLELSLRDGVSALGLAALPTLLVVMVAPLEGWLASPIAIWPLWMAAIFVGLYVMVRRQGIALVGAFAFLSVFIGGGNGILYHDRLHNYRTFTAVNQTVEAIETVLSGDINYSEMVVWCETEAYRRYCRPLQIIYWPTGVLGYEKIDVSHERWDSETTHYVVMLSDAPNVQTRIEELVGEVFTAELLATFPIPAADETRQYLGYIFKFVSLTEESGIGQ